MPPSIRIPPAVVVCALLLAVAPRAAAGQALSNGTFRQCFDAARPGDLRRVAAFVTSDAADSAKSLLKPAELLLEILAERIRGSLGAKPGDLPIGEPTFTRGNSSGAVIVTLFRNGTLRTAILPDSDDADSMRIAGTRKLAALLRSAWDEGERVFWPEKAKGDSAAFRVFFWTPPPKRDGTVSNSQARFAVAAFSLAVPWVQQATADDLPDPVYPDAPRSKGIQADITMSFVVDTTGYVMISTAHDVLPAGAPIPVGEMAYNYREFVSAAADALIKGRFHSATIAGCRYRQRVLLPFKFRIH